MKALTDKQLKQAAKQIKKAKKMKKALRKLDQLNAVATESGYTVKPSKKFVGPVQEKQTPTPTPEIKSFTKTGKPSKYTEEERSVFQSRIDNEKKNITRICNADAATVLRFCEENKVDEKNAAVRFARQAARTWAIDQMPPLF